MLLFTIGLVGGFAAGVLGIGGGIIMVPLLAYVGGLSFHSAAAVSLAQIFVGSASGVYRHYRLGSLAPRAGLLIGLGSASTAVFASAVAPDIPDLYLQVAFVALLLASGVLLLVPKREPPPGIRPRHAPLPLLGLGMSAGAVTGTLGAGGGFFMVPLLIHAFNMGTRVAIGTSLAAILLGSLSAIATKWVTGQIDPALALLVVLGGAIGAQLGAVVCHRVPPLWLRRALFALLAVIALRTIAQVLGYAA